jgi:hypothetical protein
MAALMMLVGVGVVVKLPRLDVLSRLSLPAIPVLCLIVEILYSCVLCIPSSYLMIDLVPPNQSELLLACRVLLLVVDQKDKVGEEQQQISQHNSVGRVGRRRSLEAEDEG